MRPYSQHRTNRLHRLALWLGCEGVKDGLAMIALGIILGFLFAEAV